MSSLTAHFGLGEETQIDSVVVNWPSGITNTVVSPDVNSNLLVEEEENVVGIKDEILENLKVYPNPADDFLNVELPSNFDKVSYRILDVNGKLVKQGNLRSKRIEISNLTTGSYLLQLIVEGARVETKIIKQ
jgi:hypothetical protein